MSKAGNALTVSTAPATTDDVIANVGGNPRRVPLRNLGDRVRQDVSIYTPEMFGAVGDGNLSNGAGTDDSDAFIAAIAAIYAAGGGTLLLSRKTYRLTKALIFPNTSTASVIGTQPPICIAGAGHYGSAGAASIASVAPSAGSILMWTAEGGLDVTGGSPVAKIDTRGIGSLVLEDFTLASRGCSLPFVQTTFTTIKAQRLAAWTNRSSAQSEDFFVLGGTVGFESDGGDRRLGTMGFQGYGTVIRDCTMLYGLRRFAYLRKYCNAVVVADNNIWVGNGGNCAIEIDGGDPNRAVGNQIRGNLIELGGYVYGIKIQSAIFTNIIGNTGFDEGGGTVAMVRLNPVSDQNLIVGANGPTVGGVYLSNNSGGSNNVYLAAVAAEGTNLYKMNVGSTSTFNDNMTLTGLNTKIGHNGANGMEFASQMSAWQPSPGSAGAFLLIFSGSGGGYLDLKNYKVRDYDHLGNLRSVFSGVAASGAGIGWDLGAAGDASIYRDNGAKIAVNVPFRLKSYTVGTAPSASAMGAGSEIYVTNGNAGAACKGVSDGSAWKVVALGATIS